MQTKDASQLRESLRKSVRRMRAGHDQFRLGALEMRAPIGHNSIRAIRGTASAAIPDDRMIRRFDREFIDTNQDRFQRYAFLTSLLGLTSSAWRLTLQSPYKEEPARYRKALVILPSIFGLVDVPSAVAQLGGGSVRGKKEGIADGQLVLISGCVHDKGASWH